MYVYQIHNMCHGQDLDIPGLFSKRAWSSEMFRLQGTWVGEIKQLVDTLAADTPVYPGGTVIFTRS